MADQIARFARQGSQQNVQMIRDVLQQGISGQGDTPAGGHLRLVRAELLADEHNWVSLLRVGLHSEHCSGAFSCWVQQLRMPSSPLGISCMQRAVASEAGLAAKAAAAVQPASLTEQQRASAVQAEAGVRQVQAHLALGQDQEAMQAAEQVSARGRATLVCCTRCATAAVLHFACSRADA